MKFQLMIFPELLKFCHILPTKYFRDNLNRQEEIFAIVFPVIFYIQSTAKNDGMDMRMKVHCTSPGMKDADIADISPKILVVHSQFTQST